MQETLNGASQFLLVSGATSGIGLATAKLAIDNGYHVIACCYPELETGAELKQYRPGQVSLVVTDVSDESTVISAFEQVREIVGNQGLKGLVNCAGIAILCPAELITVAEYRRTIEINLIGTFSMCRAALPLLRKAGGTIVNVSSDAGLLAMPTGAAYCASKYAIEALSDALRAETRQQGIKVVVVEPGNIDTPIWDAIQAPLKKKYTTLDAEQRQHYGDYFEGLLAIERQGIPVQRVASVIVGAVVSRKPKTRYRVGTDAHFSWLIGKLPARLRDTLANRIVKSYAKQSENSGVV
jgi:NAD(P)-dependent dehydrogenase (short-subunit alcohol dehydrogenase family)